MLITGLVFIFIQLLYILNLLQKKTIDAFMNVIKKNII